jgi:hypothetical protein
LAASAPLSAPSAAAAPEAPAPAFQIALSTGGHEWVRRDGTVEIKLDRWPTAGEGRLAVLLGPTDVTDLFQQRGADTLAYRPELLPLPPGEHEVVVFLVPPQGAWRELGRFPLRVLRAGGLQRASLARRLDLTAKAQLDQRHRPADSAPPRGNYQDGSLQIDVQASVARGGWQLDPTLNVVGVTHRPEALRFASQGDGAPPVDLSAYGLRLSRGRGYAHLGHLSFGEHKLLVSGMSSRGLQLVAPLGRQLDVSLAAVHGTQMVGWDNPLGIEEEHHRILAGRIGFELVPARAGALRVEAAYLDGSVLPQFGFNARQVNDAETSDGWGLRLLGASAAQRLRFEGGWATSTFDNPAAFDPQLAGDLEVVAVEPESRDGHYGSLTLGLLRKSWASGRSAALDLTLRHDRVEPLYRTVAAFVQADRQEDAGELQLTVGPLAISASHARSRDNLDGVPSILTTRTRRNAGNLALPLGQLGAPGTQRAWLPLLTLSLDRTHQFGDGVPPDSGFAASHVPDQVSVQGSLGLDWSGERWRFGYRHNRSDQDNRQPGRERADLRAEAHQLTLAFTPLAAFDLGFDLGHEESESVEQQRRERTRRYGLNTLWRITERMTLAANASQSERHDEPRTGESEDWSADVQWAWRFERDGMSGQLYLRWYDQESSAFDRLFGFATERAGWTLTTGVNFGLH